MRAHGGASPGADPGAGQLGHEADLALLLALAHEHHAHFGARRLGQVAQVDVAAADLVVVDELALVVHRDLRRAACAISGFPQQMHAGQQLVGTQSLPQRTGLPPHSS